MGQHKKKALRDISVQELVVHDLMQDKIKIEQIKRKFQDRQLKKKRKSVLFIAIRAMPVIFFCMS